MRCYNTFEFKYSNIKRRTCPMKKYEQPAIELIKFSITDVLSASKTDNFTGQGVESQSGSTPESGFNDLFGQF